MPFCPQCGVENPASARFCDQCGGELIPVPASGGAAAPMSVPAASIAAIGATLAAGPSACPQCGTAVIPGEAFCDNCGASLLGAAVATAGSAAPPSLPYGGVSPQPNYPPPQPVGAQAAPPPILTPQVATPPAAATPGRSSLAGVRLALQPSGASLSLPSAEQVVLGRADPVSNVFPDLDLGDQGALERGVGRRHARVYIQAGQLFVEDLDSTNGTFVNGSRLAPRQAHALAEGDELRLGNLAFRVYV